MRIEADQMKSIEQLALKADQGSLKQLSQAERKALQLVMKALHQGQTSIEVAGFGERKLQALTSKLQIRVLKQPSSTVERMGKGFANMLGLRFSSAKLKKELGAVSAKYARLQEIPKKIKDFQEAIIDFVEMLRFTEAFSRPVYAEQAKWIDGLLSAAADAKLPYIVARKKEIEGQIAELKVSKDPDKESKLYILEKEILSSLKKLEKYKGPNFGNEVSIQKGKWTNAAADLITRAKEAIEEDQKLLDSLIKEQSRLERELGLGGPKNRAALDKQIASHHNLIQKAQEQIENLHQVDLHIADEIQQVWSRIRSSPKAVDIIDKALQDVEKKISELQGKKSPAEKNKLPFLRRFKVGLEGAKRSNLFDRKEIADYNYTVLETSRNKAKEKILDLSLGITRREFAIEQLKKSS
ncbi:MAG: hypothetical protein LLG04_07755 [Parachlamydia sp.]|nr:hypothetical protein [Parachlamydia sp.]